MLPGTAEPKDELKGCSPLPTNVGDIGKSAGGSPAGRVEVRCSLPPPHVATAWPSWSNATSVEPTEVPVSRTLGVALHGWPAPAGRNLVCTSPPLSLVAQMATALPCSSSDTLGPSVGDSFATSWLVPSACPRTR